LPWSLEPETYHWTAAIESNGEVVVWTSTLPEEGIPNPADAKLIVASVNNAGKLVEACNAVATYDMADDPQQALNNAIRACKSALNDWKASQQ
jgi:predicted lipid-binding transport protein (Tim44 family)